MSRIQTTKLTEFVGIGPKPNEIAVSKLVMFVLLEPGDDDPGPSNRQAHTYVQKIRRR